MQKTLKARGVLPTVQNKILHTKITVHILPSKLIKYINIFHLLDNKLATLYEFLFCASDV